MKLINVTGRISGGVGAGPPRWINGRLSVLVGSLNFESVTPFHGMAMPSGGRHSTRAAPRRWGMKIGPVESLDSPPTLYNVTQGSPDDEFQEYHC